MRVIIAGGSGFLGRALTAGLQARGDDVRILTRAASASNHIAWNPLDLKGAWADEVTEADAVVNLAGESVEKGRWSPARKRVLIDSRMITSRAIVQAISRTRREGVLLNASAVGYYGTRNDESLTEESSAGNDFLATLCRKWEDEASKASGIRRVVFLRTGLVLDTHQGALARLLLPFRLGLGGPMGDGQQYWSWIHLQDWVRLVLFAIDDARVSGPINLTAPTPVSNRDFARALGRALRRPAILPAPAFALKLLLGEMAEPMVLGGQRVLPARAQALGFTFAFAGLDAALQDLV